MTSLVGPYKNTSSTRTVADALKIVEQATDVHVTAALKIISAAQSDGVALTGLTRRFQEAILKVTRKHQPPICARWVDSIDVSTQPLSFPVVFLGWVVFLRSFSKLHSNLNAIKPS